MDNLNVWVNGGPLVVSWFGSSGGMNVWAGGSPYVVLASMAANSSFYYNYLNRLWGEG